MNKGFWKDRRVLVTGFEGFLGSCLTRFLSAAGARICGLDIKTGRKSTILTRDDYRKITFIKGNVRNYSLMKKIINDNKISIVFHLAAEAIVSKGYFNPIKNYSTNIGGTWTALEACRHAKSVDAIIIASSDKAYGSHKKLPYRENTPLTGRSPYDVSKSCADLIACSYAYAYGLPTAITRCGNIYGPGDFNFSRIVPDTIKCALTDKQLLIRSNGKFTRDYVYVDDIVSGYILLAEKLQSLKLHGQAFNFSNENPIAVLGLVKEIYKIMGISGLYKILDTAIHEIPHQYLNSDKARKVLGWRPRISLGSGMDKTIAWYRTIFLKK